MEYPLSSVDLILVVISFNELLEFAGNSAILSPDDFLEALLVAKARVDAEFAEIRDGLGIKLAEV